MRNSMLNRLIFAGRALYGVRRQAKRDAALAAISELLKSSKAASRFACRRTPRTDAPDHRSPSNFVLALAFLATALVVSSISARAESLLLTGANVHTISGETLSPGQVRVENGKI